MSVDRFGTERGRNQLGLMYIIGREMLHAKVNTLLCLVVVAVATGLFIAMVSVSRASVDETRVLMKAMGFNLLITPEGVEPARYQALDFQDDVDMPEEYVGKLAEESGIMAQHFVGKYQKKVEIEGYTLVLTGVLAEVLRVDTRKTPMPTAYEVSRGQVFIGSAAARALEKKPGDSVRILGRRFEVGKVLEEVGAIPEDIRVYAHLHDVQALVGQPGRINAIDALACQCPASLTDITEALRQSVQRVLPDVNVQPYHSILLARHKQRVLMHRLELFALAVVMAVSAAAIWGLTHQNVSSRRHEIGVLRALGVWEARIALIFLGRILCYSLAGAVLGCVLGWWAAEKFNVAESSVVLPWHIYADVLVVTPLAALLLGLPPIVAHLLREAVETLGEGEA